MRKKLDHLAYSKTSIATCHLKLIPISPIPLWNVFGCFEIGRHFDHFILKYTDYLEHLAIMNGFLHLIVCLQVFKLDEAVLFHGYLDYAGFVEEFERTHVFFL